MIQIEFSHDQILALLYVISVVEDVPSGNIETHVDALIEAKLTLENAAQFEDHIIMPDGHRLPDERDKS
jgi:hypothetical protein